MAICRLRGGTPWRTGRVADSPPPGRPRAPSYRDGGSADLQAAAILTCRPHRAEHRASIEDDALQVPTRAEQAPSNPLTGRLSPVLAHHQRDRLLEEAPAVLHRQLVLHRAPTQNASVQIIEPRPPNQEALQRPCTAAAAERWPTLRREQRAMADAGELGRPAELGRHLDRCWRTRCLAGDAVPYEAPARTGIGTAPMSWSSLSEVSPGGAHQHEAQAHAVRNGAWSATASGSVCGLRLIANAAMAPTATSAAPIITAGFMPSTNCWPEP